MEKLPTEILSEIMRYLSLVDRLSCSLTCRRWSEAMTSSRLLGDVWLDIAGHEVEATTSVLVHTQRQYPNLRLYKANLAEFDSEFWRKIGKNLRVLELCYCWWSTQVFYAILQRCTKLESLKIKTYDTSIEDFVLPEGVYSENLRDSLGHLRHLSLHMDLTAEILDHLLGLMPRVTSIFLAAWFDKDSDFLERLSSILEKNGITSTAIKFTFPESEEVIRCVEATSSSLEELRIVTPRELTRDAFDAIVNCTRLRRLTIRVPSSTSFDASHLEKLIANSPGLEFLQLNNAEHLGFEDMVHIVKLEKLRTLKLEGYARKFQNDPEPLCRFREISTLVELDLKGNSVDSREMRSLGCLRNLRTLVLDSQFMDSECFEAICENFERLTKLDLGEVCNLTDVDMSKLCRFKDLRSLSLSYGRRLTDLTFKRGVGSRAMKSLYIEGCPITDAGLASIASHHDRLEKLTIHSCKKITDAGVKALLQSEPRLKEFSYCGSVRGETSTSLRNFCPRLRKCAI